MVRLLIWKGDLLLADRAEADESTAVRVIDAWLTEIHQGNHGAGTFEIDAWFCDATLRFQRPLATVRGVVHPANRSA